MSRTWSELLGDADGGVADEQERTGFFGRLRDSLSKSRRALVAELGASFDPADEEALETPAGGADPGRTSVSPRSGTIERPRLERLRHREQKDDRRGLGPLAEKDRAGRRR